MTVAIKQGAVSVARVGETGGFRVSSGGQMELRAEARAVLNARATRHSPLPLILALDGHDGAGKTTLARRLAAALDAPYVYPFSGAEGSRILAAAESGGHAEAQRLASGLLHRAVANPAPVLVFDRHWMTLFTLLPESYWQAWQPLPATMLCWADLQTTMARLDARDEEPMPLDWHRRYVDRYAALASRFGCRVVRTDLLSEDEAAAHLLGWAGQRLREAAFCGSGV